MLYGRQRCARRREAGGAARAPERACSPCRVLSRSLPFSPPRLQSSSCAHHTHLASTSAAFCKIPRWITLTLECGSLVDAERQKEEDRQSNEYLELKIARDEQQGLVLAKQLEIHRESERKLEAQVWPRLACSRDGGEHRMHRTIISLYVHELLTWLYLDPG
jgi:hypothetical protein